VKNGNAVEKRSRRFSRDVWSRLSDEELNAGYVVLADNPSRDFFHPVCEDEIRRTLDRMPRKLTRHLRAVVMPKISDSDLQRGVEARRRFSCIILNPFPKTLRTFWSPYPPSEKSRRHYEPWRATWERTSDGWYQLWDSASLKRYYLNHLMLHELGHLNQPWFNSLKRREDFAEDFALTWARKLNVLKRPTQVARTAPAVIEELPQDSRPA
jgi:hypothetical protein